MINASVNIGFICPKCTSSVDIGVNNYNLCPSCGTEMIPNQNGNNVSANVACKNCHSIFRLINLDKCPDCGQPF